jgi:hypothetical protein
VGDEIATSSHQRRVELLAMTELKEEILTSHDMLLPHPLTSLIFTSSSGTTAKHGVDHKKAHLKIIFSKNKFSLVKNLILP